MCGIGGILRVWPPDQRHLALRTPHAESIPEQWLNILDDSIKHRGPDGQGRFRDRALRADGCVVDVAFVHRRLSIIDHAGGAQPMLSNLPLREGGGRGEGSRISVAPQPCELSPFPLLFHGPPNTPVEYRSIAPPDGAPTDRIAVVFNGCIYNHRALRAELQRAGHVFHTDHSDTEVLVHGWREWQEDLFKGLDGMFAAVLWTSEGTLVLARDPFGEKPLHTWHAPFEGGWVNAFGSVPVVGSGLEREVSSSSPVRSCPKAISSWLRFGFGSTVPVSGSGAVTPGQAVRYESFRHSESVFELPADGCPLPESWQFGPMASDGSLAWQNRFSRPTARTVEQSLARAVESRLVADREVGCFLSGGVDSSLLACMACRALGSLRTFTVRMPDDRYDESMFAERVASHIGSNHAVLDCDPKPADDLAMLIRQMGQPFGDSSLLPTYWLSRAVRREVAVALSGDGADELFGGYERYQAAGWMNNQLLQAPLLSRLLGLQASPKSRRSKLGRLADAASNAGYYDLISIFPTSMLFQLLQDDESKKFDEQWRSVSPPLDRVDWAILTDINNYLPEDILRKSDSASMAVALEVRAPFLEPRLAMEAISTDLDVLIPGGQRKGLLRQVARRYLPSEIVDRPKMGFAIPIGEWFRTDYGGLRTMLLDHLNSTEPFGPPSLGIDLNRAFIRQMLDEHLGTGPSGLIKRDHSQRLYMLLVLSIWSKWLGGLR